jgi:hypothetical protein
VALGGVFVFTRSAVLAGNPMAHTLTTTNGVMARGSAGRRPFPCAPHAVLERDQSQGRNLHRFVDCRPLNSVRPGKLRAANRQLFVWFQPFIYAFDGPTRRLSQKLHQTVMHVALKLALVTGKSRVGIF